MAYAIFEKNGRLPGRDQENWLEAEAQLMGPARKPAPTKANNGQMKPAARPMMSQRV